jgi:hypothetical protein
LLWASDYIQDTQKTSAYAKEVINAVARKKLQPKTAVAEHIELTDWAQITDNN